MSEEIKPLPELPTAMSGTADWIDFHKIVRETIEQLRGEVAELKAARIVDVDKIAKYCCEQADKTRHPAPEPAGEVKGKEWEYGEKVVPAAVDAIVQDHIKAGEFGRAVTQLYRDSEFSSVASGIAFDTHYGPLIRRQFDREAIIQAEPVRMEAMATLREREHFTGAHVELYKFIWEHLGGDDTSKRSAETASIIASVLHALYQIRGESK